ncbi:MAG: GAF domain-containing protein [Planctomycetota bacterium]
MQDKLDVLPGWSWNPDGISPELLATSTDSVLDRIVETAAAELGTPIALVTVLLDHIQLLRASRGLPEDLLEVGVTDRAASFCQYVVRDEQPFAVGDATRDERVPQYLVENYGLRSYYGVPVRVAGQVIGSLCVIDTEPREFDEEQRRRLSELGALVDERFAEFTGSATRHAQSPRAVRVDALNELRRCLRASSHDTANALVATTELKAALRTLTRVAQGRPLPSEATQHAALMAERALESADDSLFNLRATLGDAADVADALRSEADVSSRPRLSEIAVAGRELARWAAADVGGIQLPPFHSERDAVLGVPRGFGVLLVGQVLQGLARELIEIGEPSGIRVESRAADGIASMLFEARLDAEQLTAVAAGVQGSLAGEPGVQVGATDKQVVLDLPLVEQDAAGSSDS